MNNYPLIAYKKECFQEYLNEISLVLWCYNCNWNCNWCSLKLVIYEKSNIINVNYLELIKNHTELESAIVFLGGEPTLYPQGLIEGCKLSKELKLKTKIFTNGSNVDILVFLVKNNLLNAISIDYKYYEYDIDSIIKELIKYDIDIDIRITTYPNLNNLDLMKEKIENYDKVKLYIQKWQKF